MDAIPHTTRSASDSKTEVDLFTENWATAWAAALNASPVYRQAAAKWRWPLVVRVDDGPSWRLDLYKGECRSIESSGPENDAPFVISGPRSAWESVLQGDTAPMVAVMQGLLRLDKGSKVRLARFTSAAREMLNAAVSVSGGGHGAGTEPSPRHMSDSTEQSNGASMRHDDDRGTRTGFRTTSTGGLDFESFPMQLYAKSKKLGIWDPAEISFAQDREDWRQLEAEERDVLLRLISMFQAGEEAVTLDLLPLIRVIAHEGRLEEEMYLTTFLFEEAKHTEFFRRFLNEVPQAHFDLEQYFTPAYHELFCEELPSALSALDRDSSPLAQLRASSTYNMIVEGTLAETGYRALYQVLDERSILPGLREGVGLLQRDESRHIAYGVHLITRILRSDPSLEREFQAGMDALLPVATRVISELFDAYDPMPFGLSEEDFLDYAMDQFSKRMRRIRAD